jgi:GT2 family glycosyltransferase
MPEAEALEDKGQFARPPGRAPELAGTRPLLAESSGADTRRLGIILVNFRQPEATIECLESLLRIDGNFRIVVVENGSGDDSAERIRAWARGDLPYVPPEGRLAALTTPAVDKPVNLAEPSGDVPVTGTAPRLVMIVSPENLGFAGGNNLGARWLLGDRQIDRIWFLNNDTVITPGSVDALLRTFESDPRIGMVGTAVRYYDEPTRLQALNGMQFSWLTGQARPVYGGRQVTEPFDSKRVVDETSFVLGASLAITRAFWDAVGPMSERYFLYYEEMDWAVRNAGRFRVGFARGAIVYHKHGGSIGSSAVKGGRSALSDYYMLRSRLLFYRQHQPLLLPLIWVQGAAQTGMRLMRRQPEKAMKMARALFGLSY